MSPKQQASVCRTICPPTVEIIVAECAVDCLPCKPLVWRHIPLPTYLRFSPMWEETVALRCPSLQGPHLGHPGLPGACQNGNATGIWLSALLFCACTWPCVAGQNHYIMPELEMLMVLLPDLSEKSPTRRSPMPCPELTAVIQIS